MTSEHTGRFAPSPSGRIHFGNAMSFLIAWLSVRSKGGRMILRLEDLDPDRCRDEYCRQLEEDLLWMGLDWDEGGLEDRADYRQRNCWEYYRDALKILEEKDLIYPCFCSRSDLHAASAPHRSDGAVLYAGTCRHLTFEERIDKAKLRSPSLRVRVPDEEVAFIDGNLGPYVENLVYNCGDFIVRRSDGVFAYQLAVVVDDARMHVTEVVRGGDLLSSTPRQIWLQRQLGLPTPRYFHIPLLLAPSGRRLAKRDKDMDIGNLRQHMTGPQLVGKLSFMAGIIDREEALTPTELIREFSWEKIKKQDIVAY